MAKTKISEFSATANSNTDINSINIAEGCAPSNINDAIRELMAELKDFQAGTKGDSFNGPVGTSTAAAGAFTTLSSTGNTTLGDASGDTVTINGTTTFANVNPTLSGTANGVLYLNGSKVATSGSALTFDGTSLGVNSSSTIDGGRFNVAFAGNTQNGICLKDTADASGASFWGAYNSTGGFIGSLRRNGTDNALAINGNSYLSFQQNSTEQMRLTSTGLGIGTSSITSGAKLDVNGQIVAQNGSTSSLGFAFRSATSSGMYLYDDGVGANMVLQANANNNQLYLQRTGNVGIGTSSPAAKLDVQGVASALYSFEAKGQVQANSANKITLSLESASTGRVAVFGADGSTYGTLVSSRATSTGGTTESARIDSSGNLLIGQTSGTSGYKLQIGATGNTNNNIILRNNGTEELKILFAGSGLTTQAVGITTASRIYVYSNYDTATGVYLTSGGTTWNATSDERSKENLVPITNAAQKVSTLRAVTGNFISDAEKKSRAFLIAQDVQKVLPEAVDASNPDELGLAYSDLIPLLVAAIKEQQSIIEQLTSRIQALESK